MINFSLIIFFYIMIGERGLSIWWNILLKGGIMIIGINCIGCIMVEIVMVLILVYFVKLCICIFCICDVNGMSFWYLYVILYNL